MISTRLERTFDMNFYLEIETDLSEAEQSFIFESLTKLSTTQDSLNSLTLDLRSHSRSYSSLFEGLESFTTKLVEASKDCTEPLFNLTLRLSNQSLSQIELTSFKNIFTKLRPETEVTLELIKYVDHQSDEFAANILDIIHHLRQDSLRKFEVDVFYAPLYRDSDTLVPADIFLQTLQLTASLGVNTLVRYINPESSVSLLDQVEYWREFFSYKLNKEFMFNALIPSFESRKSSAQRCFLFMSGHSLSFQYCIYNRFNLQGQKLSKLERELIINELEKSQKEQLRYASQTKSCSECRHLGKCVEGETLSFMKERGLTNCQYPESLVEALSK